MTSDVVPDDFRDDANVDRDPVEQLAEEFLDRRRRGQQVSIADYAQRRPDLAERIRELFPTLLLMEDLRPDDVGGRVLRARPRPPPSRRCPSGWAIFTFCGRLAGAGWALSTKRSRSRLVGTLR